MSYVPLSQSSPLSMIRRVPSTVWVLLGAGVIFTIISQMTLAGVPDAQVRFRIDLAPLLTLPIALKVHIVSALTALFVGLWLLAGPKGRCMHKKLGWVWVVAMAFTAVSSFFIVGLNGKSFSWIHGLSAWTVITLPMGIYAIRKKNVKKHASRMKGMFLGGMVIAGLFTFLPGRTMWHLFFTI